MAKVCSGAATTLGTSHIVGNDSFFGSIKTSTELQKRFILSGDGEDYRIKQAILRCPNEKG